MPRTVEVQMQIDDSGAIQSLDAQGQAYEQVAESADDASEATERQAQAAQDAGTAAERGAQAQREQADAAEANEQAQREAAQSARRYAAASDQMAGSAGNASQVIFSTGDAIQDVQFGLAGAANNIAFVAESFAELQNQAGGTRGALQGIFTALKGPAGVILGLQALLALGPQLASWFSSREGEADALGEAYSSAAEDLLSFGDDIEGFEVEGLEQAEEARDTLQERVEAQREELSVLEEIQAVREGTGADVAQMTREERRQVLAKQEQFGLEEATKEEVRQAVEEQRKQVQASESAVEQAEALVRERKAALQVERALSETDVSREDGPSPREQIGSAVGALQTLNEVSGASPSFSFEGLDEFLKGNAEKQARRMQEELKALRAQMGKTEQQALNLGPALEQGLADSIASTAQAVGQGKSVANALLNTLASLAQQVGKMMIQFGTAALGLRNLISNPALAIAAGASLVALGAAAKQAIGSEIDSATGGGGAPGGPGSERTAEGGGEIGAEVDAPGRRRGGPVRAGQLYQTHGLGQREFFRPATDGQIVTAGGMRAAAGESGGGAQRVETSHEVSVEVNDPSLFDLRQQLNELDSDVSELT